MHVTQQSFEEKWLWLQRRLQLQGIIGRQMIQFCLPAEHTVRAAVDMMLLERNQYAWLQNRIIFVQNRGNDVLTPGPEAREFTRQVFSAMLNHLLAPECRLFTPVEWHTLCYRVMDSRKLKSDKRDLYTLTGQLLGKIVLDKHAVPVHFSREIYQALLQGQQQVSGQSEALSAMSWGFGAMVGPELLQAAIALMN